MKSNARQSDLAALFSKSQAWVSLAQSRAIDPMPRDLPGARAWGIRAGLSESPAPALPVAPPAGASLFSSDAASLPASSLEVQELRLKSARADLAETEHALRTGKLLRAEDVEQRETAIAAEFRHAAVEYPLRARAILERHIADGALVERIVTDLQPLAAELLNKADARQALRDKPPAEIEAVLRAWVKKVMETIA